MRQHARPVLEAAAAITGALRAGGKVLVFGNGGSAADAQHVAAELVGRFERERAAMAAVALTTDASVLTSVANDYAFDRVFARQVEGLGRKGDVAVRHQHQRHLAQRGGGAGGGAGAGPGDDRADRRRRRRGGARRGDSRERAVRFSAARVQEVHRTLLHVICDIVERDIDQR